MLEFIFWAIAFAVFVYAKISLLKWFTK